MPLVPKIASFWRTLVRGRRLDADLDDELRAYVEEMTARKVAAGLRPRNGAPAGTDASRRVRSRQGRSPRCAHRPPCGRNIQGRFLCVADAAQGPGIHARRRDHAGARRRREHGDLQRGACVADCAIALRRSGPAGLCLGRSNRRGLSSRAAVGPGADRSRYAVVALRRLRRDLGHHGGADRRQRARTASHRPRLVGLLFAARRECGDWPHVRRVRMS